MNYAPVSMLPPYHKIHCEWPFSWYYWKWLEPHNLKYTGDKI